MEYLGFIIAGIAGLLGGIWFWAGWLSAEKQIFPRRMPDALIISLYFVSVIPGPFSGILIRPVTNRFKLRFPKGEAVP